MARILIPGLFVVGGVVIGMTLLSALGDYLSGLTGSTLLGDTIVLAPLITVAAVLGWQVYGPGKKH